MTLYHLFIAIKKLRFRKNFWKACVISLTAPLDLVKHLQLYYALCQKKKCAAVGKASNTCKIDEW